MTDLSYITAQARVPDELLHYVKSIGGLDSSPLPGGVLHSDGEHGVLVCFGDGAQLEASVDQALRQSSLRQLTVLAGQTPPQAPQDAAATCDQYWRIELPLPRPRGKLANMLRRAESAVRIEKTRIWTSAHQDLAENFCARKRGSLDDGTRYIFAHLGEYLKSDDGALLFSAYAPEGRLEGCAIGDYSSLATAFYMFAFRQQDATPGVADLLLWHVIQEAERQGHIQLNLGLGIDGGIEFFKRKWGAEPWLKLVETSWPIRRKGFFARLLGRE